MGNKIMKFVARLLDYPIKRRPICFLRQEDYSSTGDALPKEDTNQRGTMCEYDKLVQSFYARLLGHGRGNIKEEELSDVDVVWSSTKYPGWDSMTISNLHSLFLLFDRHLNGMLNYHDFSTVLESLGYETSNEYRKQKFDEFDRNMDGWITYEEFLEVIYFFNPQENDSLSGLAKSCVEIADNIKFVTSLSVVEQLEYGLF